MKKVYVIQGNYGYGWDDLTEHDNRKEALKELKVYQANEKYGVHRMIVKKEAHND